MSRLVLPLVFASLILGSCSGGGSGGGGGGGGATALGSLGLATVDLGESATFTAVTSLRWATDDTLISTLTSGCPTATAGPDDDSSGTADWLHVDFDCTITDENLTLLGNIFLGENHDPAFFFDHVPVDYLADVGVSDQDTMSWAMSGQGLLEVTGVNGTCTLQVGVQIAEFPALNKVVFFVTSTIGDFPVASGIQIQVFSNAIFTLPADDSSDIPSGYVDTYMWHIGGTSPFATFECQMLDDGTFHFELFNANDGLVARGLIDLAQGDEDEIIFQ
ncbi:MAG: hypothetical protein IPJ19_13535 [Planctomycetes bacterium]|nr:hypothetical protein [Planctomycetota bacterium]